MPIDNTRSHSEIVQELMDAYEKTGRIGKITPEDRDDALRISNKIAFEAKEDK